MEKENKRFFNHGVIIAVAIILIIGAFYFGRSLNNQAPITTQTIEQNINLSSKCDTDAKNYFDNYKEKIKLSDNMQQKSISYQNYYDQNNGSCYVLTNESYNVKELLSGNPYTMISYSLVDVSKKDPYGNYQWIGQYSESIAPGEVFNGVKDCNVGAINCSSLNQFLSMVNPYFGR